MEGNLNGRSTVTRLTLVKVTFMTTSTMSLAEKRVHAIDAEQNRRRVFRLDRHSGPDAAFGE